MNKRKRQQEINQGGMDSENESDKTTDGWTYRQSRTNRTVEIPFIGRSAEILYVGDQSFNSPKCDIKSAKRSYQPRSNSQSLPSFLHYQTATAQHELCAALLLRKKTKRSETKTTDDWSFVMILNSTYDPNPPYYNSPTDTAPPRS